MRRLNAISKERCESAGLKPWNRNLTVEREKLEGGESIVKAVEQCVEDVDENTDGEGSHLDNTWLRR